MNRKPYSQILDSLAHDHMADSIDLAPRVLARIQRGNHFTMKPQTLFAAILFALMLFASLFFVAPGVAAAIQGWFGYVPGLGLVRAGQIRVLAGPVSVTRDGVTVTVENALLNSEKTLITYKVDGIQPAMFVNDPAKSRVCAAGPTIRLPGTRAFSLAGFNKNGRRWDTGYEASWSYPVIPTTVQEATFVVPCIQGTAPGKAPENWELPLHFKPAPPDMTSLPVIEIPTSTAPVLPVAQASTSASDSLASKLTLTIDRAVQMDDGDLIYASMHWQAAPGINGVSMRPLHATVHVRDAAGREVAYEEVNEDTGGGYAEHKVIFAFKTAPIQTNGPLTIEVDSVAVGLNTDASLVLDPGPNPQMGQTYILNRDVQIGKYRLTVVSAKRETANGYTFDIKSDSGIYDLMLMNVNYPPTSGGGGGNDTGDSSLSTEISAGLFYPADAPAGPITVSIPAMTVRQDGPWQAQWTPPAVSTVVPPTPAAACLTAASWKKALRGKPALPSGLGGQVLLTGGDAGTSFLSFASLDGSGRRNFAGASNGALSPDGSILAYSTDKTVSLLNLATRRTTNLAGSAEYGFEYQWSPDGTKFVYSPLSVIEQNNIYFLDVATQRVTPLTDRGYHPLWSPDGSKIAFIRGVGETKASDLFVMNADGSGLRRLTDNGGAHTELSGWLPDGGHLLYSTFDANIAAQTDLLLDLQTSESQPFPSESVAAALSPNDKYIFTQDEPFGSDGRWALFISNPDGSNRRMLATADLWTLNPILSPNGKWLMLSVSNTDSLSTIATLVQLENCQIIPLAYFKGLVTSWTP